MTDLDGLRQQYGDKKFVCQNCDSETLAETIIDDLEDQDSPNLLMPEKITDTAFSQCEECEGLTLHELVETDASEPEEDSGKTEESEGHSKPQQDATGHTESNNNGSTKPFSI